ncbi:NeuD/PglB/VioB family sugar acetyltransferase [Propioniciclava tarda]|uniref:NeuD/PglB/VioB family sugar acetyltransferase n=1 Tax=Propioniciclava tarda TaxID=433330 RepID=UPI0013F1660C|nr:NeuD/PglB/VioB family sugar acetyltransferase [Propioniciclava tarda]
MTSATETKYRLIIVGGGGNGRECAQIAQAMIAAGTASFTIAGFLDDNESALVGTSTAWPLLGSISAWQPAEDERFVIAVGNPQVRAKLADSYTARGAQFINLIHPTVILATNARLGTGISLSPFSVVSDNAAIDDHVHVNLHTAIGHDAVVGRASVLSSFCDVTGNVRLGERVLLGSHASIAPGLKVGDDALVGIGAVVVSGVKSGKRVFGNPARSLAL